MSAGVARLGEAVLDESDVRLGTVGNVEFGLRHRFEFERCEDARDFT